MENDFSCTNGELAIEHHWYTVHSQEINIDTQSASRYALSEALRWAPSGVAQRLGRRSDGCSHPGC